MISSAGYYQPAGPVIGSASPGTNVAPPTATVQPTVVSSTSSSSSSSMSFNRGSSSVEQQRREEFVHHVKERESPMKSTAFFHQGLIISNFLAITDAGII